MKKILEYLTDYQSGRFIATGSFIAITWLVNLYKLIIVLCQPDVAVSKHLLLHIVGLIPPINCVTCWL